MSEEKVVLITGGASGIGRAFGEVLAERGAHVVLADRQFDLAESVAAEIRQNGRKASAVALDVRDADAYKRVVDDIVARHGRIDMLFNNAGIAVGGPAERYEARDWSDVLDVNVQGVVNGIKAAYPQMIKQRSGHIVNTASMAGLVPSPLITSYAMTKHAVVGLSTSLRIEAAPFGVRVSALCPGVIDTPILETKPPPGAWAPDARRFLTQVAGPPHPVDDFAQQVLARVERNERIIVAPARARIGWLLSRWFPGLPEPLLAKAVAAERATRAPAAALPMASGDELPAQQAPR